jgi:hypothetical protein
MAVYIFEPFPRRDDIMLAQIVARSEEEARAMLQDYYGEEEDLTRWKLIDVLGKGDDDLRL